MNKPHEDLSYIFSQNLKGILVKDAHSIQVPFVKNVAGNIEEFHNLIDEISQTGQWSNFGKMESAFKSRLESDSGRTVITTNSGTSALEVALATLSHLSPEKNLVITSPFTYIATVSAILAAGLTPVFIDIDQTYLTLDPERVEASFRSHNVEPNQVLAILPVHVFNNFADVCAFEFLSTTYGIPIGYDAAHSFGAHLRNQPALALGSFSATSFHFTKTLSAGEGGAVSFADVELAERARNATVFGYDRTLNLTTAIRGNSKMPELSAALALSNLNRLQQDIEIRKGIFSNYNEHIANLPIQGIALRPESQPNFGYFPVLVPDGDTAEDLVHHMLSNGIQVRRYFRPSLDGIGQAMVVEDCKTSRTMADRVVCLPIYPSLSAEDQGRVLGALTGYFGH